MELQPVSYHPSAVRAADPFRQCLVVVQETKGLQPDLTVLSADEIEKANRFVKEEDRLSFLLRRATLRTLLSGWLRLPPWEIIYRRETQGKPVIPDTALHFNVSKTAGWNVYYFGPQAAGIDIERIDPSRRFEEIESTQLHPAEKSEVKSDPDFFAVWTRKEAVLKADGSGITDHLMQLNTASAITEYRGQSYRLHTFAGSDFMLSLAVPATTDIEPLLLKY